MKQSFYNLLIELENKYYLFNSFYQTLAELEESMYLLLKDDEINNIAIDDKEDLITNGFLIDKNKDEVNEYLKLFENAKTETTLTVMLLLATTCNLSCTYCYQNYANYNKEIISLENAAVFLQWVENEIKNKQINGLNIQFFGGEPLLAKDSITFLLKELSIIEIKYAISITKTLITNATLLTDEICKMLVDNNVEFQITIDGINDVNNKRRFFKGTKEGTYDVIINSLNMIIQNGGIELLDIRMNVDKQNIENVEQLTEKVYNLGIKRFHCGRVLFREKQTDYDINLITNKEFDSTYDWKLFKIMKKYGYADTPSSFEINTSCNLHNKHGYVISPNLDAAKCDELLDIAEYRIGYINSNGTLIHTNNNYKQQTSVTPANYDECLNCKLLPICGSGCPIYSLNTKGTLYSSYCSETLDSVKAKIGNIIKASESE